MKGWRGYMRDAETINREIAELRAQMQNVTGTKTEIYTRIVGYYRSLTNWNKGKRDEYSLRRPFDAQNAGAGHVHERDNDAHEKPERRRSFIPEQAGAHQAIAGFKMLETA